MPETTREALHKLVDQLPDFTWDEVNLLMLEILDAADDDRTEYDPLEAPEVEPTPAEIAAMEEAYAELREGKVKSIPHAEAMKYLEKLP